MGKIKNLKILALLAFFIFPFLIFAQENTEEIVELFDAKKDPESVQTDLLVTLNVVKGDIVFENNKNVLISVDILNRLGIQPSVKYSVQLIKEIKGKQVVVDEKIYDNHLNFSENEKINLKIQYNVPDSVHGNYSLWFNCSNQNGLLLTTFFLGDIFIENEDKKETILKISNEDCYLQVKNSHPFKKYEMMSGIDVPRDGKIEIICFVKNQNNIFIKAKPFIKIYYRSLFGQMVYSEEQDYASTDFKPLEEREISLSLPTYFEPQSYSLETFWIDETKEIVSNSVFAHYVLRGSSATIQNIFLDKNFYLKGEFAKLNLFWTPSSDISSVEVIGGNPLESLVAEISILSDDEKCSKMVKEVLIDDFNFKQDFNFLLEIPIEKKCINPIIFISLKDDLGKEYDNKTFNLIRKKEIGNEIYFVFLFIFLFLMIYFAVKNKKLFFIVFILIIFYCFYPNNVNAEVYGIGEKGIGSTVITLNIPELYFYPNQYFILSGKAAHTADCRNIVNAATVVIANLAKTNVIPPMYANDNDLIGERIGFLAEPYSTENFSLKMRAPDKEGEYYLKIVAGILWADDAYNIGFNYVKENGNQWAYSVAYKYKVIVKKKGNPPTIPTINLVSGLKNVKESLTFSFVSTDPEGDKIKYLVDWNADDGVDTINATTDFTNSGTPATSPKSWLTGGSKRIKAKAQDEGGNMSDWGYYTFTIDPCVSTKGAACSATNACGTNTGVIACDGSCSVLPPIIPVGYGSKCTATNMCGMTNPNAKIGCDAKCAPAPSDSLCLIDSGVRIDQGGGDIVKIAADPKLNPKSPVRVMTKDGVRSIPVTSNFSDPGATKIRIMTKDGIRALIKYISN